MNYLLNMDEIKLLLDNIKIKQEKTTMDLEFLLNDKLIEPSIRFKKIESKLDELIKIESRYNYLVSIINSQNKIEENG